MQAIYVQRLRLTFSKNGPTRFIGHLDLARTMERALNRAKIPVAYSQGFNRRPKIQFATALPLGYTSEAELADIWLLERLDPAGVLSQLMSRMAPGLIVQHIAEIPLFAPALQTITQESIYQVRLREAVEPAVLNEAIRRLLACQSLIRQRKDKEYDLRPMVLDLQLAEESLVLTMRLSLLPAQTGRPDEVLDALGLEPLNATIHRTAIILDKYAK